MTFKAELRCHIPIKDVNPTLIYRSRIQVSHVLAVVIVIHAEHLRIDIPVIISPFTRFVSAFIHPASSHLTDTYIYSMQRVLNCKQ